MGFASRRIRATWASPVIAYGSPRKCSLHDSGRAAAHARRSFGRIINISSVVGETGAFGQANYAASKSGLHSGLSRSGGLRGHCPWLSACRAAKIPGAPTYSGQRRRSECHVTSFTQVNGCMEWQTGAYCKTVGSAYVGSNPTPATTPATTCKNGPLAAETRPGGPFLLVTACIRVRHCGSMRGSVRVHMVYSVRVKLAVRITARFADSRPFCPVARAP